MDADKRGEFGMNAAYRRAQSMQRMAADPVHSVFVSANAGSGKTKVLVERVSRILLNGTKPDKILCLTYTKAAASEMQTRLFEVLGDWSILPENQLVGIIHYPLIKRLQILVSLAERQNGYCICQLTLFM